MHSPRTLKGYLKIVHNLKTIINNFKKIFGFYFAYPQIIFGKEIYNILLGEKRSLKIIDVPCGNGIVTGVIAKLTDSTVEGYDISESAISCAKDAFSMKNIHFGIKDIFDVLQDKKYDIICIVNSLLIFSNGEKLIPLTYNALDKQGKAIFIIPNTRSKNFQNFQVIQPSENKFIISKEEAVKRFTQAGFKVEMVKGLCWAYQHGRKELKNLKNLSGVYMMLLNAFHSCFRITEPSYYLFLLSKNNRSIIT